MDEPRHRPYDPRIGELLSEARWLQQLAQRLVGDPVEAEDVTQETWVAALVGAGRARGRRAWLAEVARNVVRQRRRSEASRRRREAIVARAEACDLEAEAVARAEGQRALVDAVLALPEPYRSTVILHYFDHLEVAAVARRSGVTESTVRSRLSRAVQELRRSMRREHGERWALVLTPLVPLAPTGFGPAIPPPESAPIDPATVPPPAPIPLDWLTFMVTNTKLALAGAAAVACIWLLVTTLSPSDESVDNEASVSRPTVQAPESADGTIGASATESSAPVTDTRTALLEPAQPVGAASTSSAFASLEVRVRFADDGTPAADIGVMVTPWGAPDPFVGQRAARCDAQGVARFQDLAAGKATIGLDRATGASSLLVAGVHSVVELLVPDGADVVGLVVDSEARPVSGARVWLSQHGNHLEGADVTRSDDTGRFTIRDVSAGRQLGARHAELGPSALQRLPDDAPGQRVEVKLVLGGESSELAGTVRDPAGRGLEGADITVHVVAIGAPGTPLARQRLYFAADTAVTDELGRFVLRVGPSGVATVVARAPAMAPLEREVELASGRQELELVLTPMAVVRGRVVDREGLPVADAFVGHGPYAREASAQTRSKDDGSFELTGLPSGAVEVAVNAGDRGAVRRTFDLSPMDEVEWLVELGAGPGISGRVIDHRDQPIAGLPVFAVDTSDHGANRKQTKTDEAGKFELADWPANADSVFVRELGDRSGEPVAYELGVRPGKTGWLELRVAANARRTAHVVGQVTDSAGEPISGASVTAEYLGPSGGVTTDDTGHFALGPVRPGPCLLRVSANGFAGVVLRDLELAADETRNVRVRLERPGSVEVSVRLPAEWVVAAWDESWVKGDAALVSEEGWHVAAIPLERGVGRVEHVAPGRYRLVLRSSFLQTDGHVDVDVLSGDVTRVELVALLGASRLVEVSDAGIAGLDRIRVLVRAPDGRVVFQSASAWSMQYQPRFLVNGLDVGSYTIEVRTDSGRQASDVIEVLKLGPGFPSLALTLE